MACPCRKPPRIQRVRLFFRVLPYEVFKASLKTRLNWQRIHPMGVSIMMNVIVAKVDRAAFIRVILFPGAVELSCCTERIRPLGDALPVWRSIIREIGSFTLSGSVFFK
ncbi:hypothetical protein [Azospirillum lipoferum]|uniref:hypothetical protein n=1 Tax=Azospirillum lipoferum TaxID=193 RepID=UPI001395E889|nr:hypothetical protein [Azospirillum lipoferum]